MANGMVIEGTMGLIVLLAGAKITVIPIIGPIALPHIKKQLKIWNDWRAKNNLRTHGEFKRAMTASSKDD